MSKKSTVAFIAVLVAPGLLVGAGMLVMLLLSLSAMSAISSTDSNPASDTCGAPSLQVSGSLDEGLEVAGYSGVQLENAAEILRAGAALEISQYGQTIAVMTAMGESTLQVIDHGDDVGPDSRGLFQQRDNGAWGSYADRMDPATSATNFFRALLRVEGWETMEPTIAAHSVQRNADPYHYTDYWDAAVAVVAALTAASSSTLTDEPTLEQNPTLGATDQDPFSAAAIAPCAAAYSGIANTSGWAHPVPTFTTFWNNYGQNRGSYKHAGEDFAAPADTPILAAADGLVSHVSCDAWQGRSPCNIVVDHGVDDGGHTVQTVYVHMYPEDVFVQQGQQVTAGENIAGVGTNGNSTGNHLHFEVWIDGSPVDPQDFMLAVGIDLTDPTATEIVNAQAADPAA